MGGQSKTVADVELAVNAFRSMLAPDIAERVSLSKPYKFIGEDANWPMSYDRLWERRVRGGVYLIFDRMDQLLYVGKAASLGTRLGAYFNYAEQPPDRTRGRCTIVDPRMTEAVFARVIAFEEDTGDDRSPHFLVPALESLLIARLNPPINKHGRTVWEE